MFHWYDYWNKIDKETKWDNDYSNIRDDNEV